MPLGLRSGGDRRRIRLAGAACLLCLFSCAPGEASRADRTWVTIRGQRVAVEIAAERPGQARGLGGRDALAWNHGMLFLYETPGFYAFWMKDMRFDIDIVWILDGRITEILARVAHSLDGPGPTYRPRQLTDQVLEVPAGYTEARGWRVGDRVRIDRGSSGALPTCRAASVGRGTEGAGLLEGRELGEQLLSHGGVQSVGVQSDQRVKPLVDGETASQLAQQACPAEPIGVFLDPGCRQDGLQVRRVRIFVG